MTALSHLYVAVLALTAGLLTLAVAWRLRPSPVRVCRIAPVAPARPRAPSSRRGVFAAGPFAIALVTLVLGPVGFGLLVVAAFGWRRGLRTRALRRRSTDIEQAFPDFVDMLLLSLGSGSTPVQALHELRRCTGGVVGEAVSETVRSLQMGEPFAQALGVLSSRLGNVAQPLVDTLSFAHRHGTPLSAALDRLAADARAARRRRADTLARQLPIKLAFPLVGCTLPAFVLLTLVPLLAGTVSSLRGFSPP